jgi:hypothetical protein
VPAAHAVQTKLPCDGWYWPAAQFAQAEAAMTMLAVPAGHGRHVALGSEMAGLNVPYPH